MHINYTTAISNINLSYETLLVSLLWVFVLYFFYSMALTMHKTQKVFKCI